MKQPANPMTMIEGTIDVALTWNYLPTNARTASLYGKAKAGQWNVDDIDWSLDARTGPVSGEESLWGSRVPDSFPLPVAQLPEFSWQYHVWLVSQFLHGEQGALLAAARLVEVLPTMEAKLLAASQVIDEARHVEVYTTYIDQRLGESYDVSPALEELLRQIVRDRRWDLLCLGMQIIIEGLALAAFRLSHGVTDQLITSITERIARDESRHVSFGMVQLSGYYNELTWAERRDREEFVLEAAQLMARRFDLPEVWERLDVRAADGREFLSDDPMMISFRQILFSRVNASIARLDLMTPFVKEGLTKLRLYKPVLGERAGGARN